MRRFRYGLVAWFVAISIAALMLLFFFGNIFAVGHALYPVHNYTGTVTQVSPGGRVEDLYLSNTGKGPTHITIIVNEKSRLCKKGDTVNYSVGWSEGPLDFLNNNPQATSYSCSEKK